MSTIRNILSEWSPRQLWSPTLIFVVAILILKLLVFAVIWSSATSFSQLLNPLVYVHVILLSFILASPLGLFHRKWVEVGVLFAVDLWLVGNLFWGGTCLASVAPLHYLLLGAFSPLVAAIPVAVAWFYLFFPLTTLVVVWISRRNKGRIPVPLWGKLQYVGYLLAWSTLAWLLS